MVRRHHLMSRSEEPAWPLRSGTSPIFHCCLRLNLVALEDNFTGLFFDPDADGLLARVGRAGVTDDVVLENQTACFTADADSSRFALEAVVLNQVFLQPIAVTGHALGFVAKVNSILLIGPHLVVLQEIVRVLMSD